MSVQEKAGFLKNAYITHIRGIDPETPPVFGKMNPQQMVEHMAAYIRLGYGNPEVPEILTPAEHLDKMINFLLSDKPFKDNTPNSLMPETPPAPVHDSYEGSVLSLEAAVNELFEAFQTNPELTVVNPFFGRLNYEMTMHLLHKHAWHHLRQFGVPTL